MVTKKETETSSLVYTRDARTGEVKRIAFPHDVQIGLASSPQDHPDLCIPVLKAAADLIPEPAHKKARTSGASDLGKPDTPGAGTGGGLTSSPVPDSDH